MTRLWLFSLIFLLSFSCDAQIISTFAGGGTNIPGDGLPATMTRLSDPCGGTFDKFGNYYFTEASNGHRVRKIATSGIIATLAGTGTGGYSGDGGPATAAMLHGPTCVVLDSIGNIYISDAQNFRIRKIDAQTGFISTIAGNGVGGYSGDGISATLASISNAPGIFVDKKGNLFIADYGNARVRKVNTSGIISNFAGNGIISGYSGDGSKADTARIGGISDVTFDTLGNAYLCGNGNSSIYKVNPSGIIIKVAGTGIGYLFNGDEIPATNANIDPQRLALDKFGNLLFGEYHNYRVRLVTTNGLIHTVAGIGTPGFSGDGGLATAAQLFYPVGIALDSCDNLFIPEANNNRIRKVTYSKCNYLNVELRNIQNSITIYPNPAENNININNLKTSANYQLLNITGIIEQSGTLKQGNNSISLKSLPPGLHLLELVNEDGERTVSKIVKE